jgi:hypothetical protein
MKPEFSKPFDQAAARAGAPFCCRDGRSADILKWDGRRPGEPLIGFQSDSDIPASWTAGGAYETGSEGDIDLVMLPLGLIDGEPVFVGDTFLWHDGTPKVATAEMAGGDWGRCAWPAPANVYPTFTQKDIDTLDGWSGHNWQVNFANAALRHAIDAGQVVQVPQGTDERDRKLAVAVRTACLEVSANFNHAGMSLPEALFKCRGAISALALSDIIATVK